MRPRLVCVEDDTPEITLDYLAEACAARGVEFVRIDAGRFEFDPQEGLADGDMLYRAGISGRAIRVEQQLLHPGVATFYAEPLGAFWGPINYPLLFQQIGLPMPRTLPMETADRAALERAVTWLGGYPVVVKVLGGSRGVGVLRADGPTALYALADLLLADGRTPFMSAYVDPADHWRVTVVGERAVAAYLNPREPGDFRTYGSERPEDFLAEPPADLAELALAAAQATRVELAGVDILRHESGRLYVLEANFPCYFAQAQEFGGVDVAGAMVEHLMGKARRR